MKGMKMRGGRGRKVVESMMREVHRDEPSTVTRAKQFGSKGKEGMLRAVAMSKARAAGARMPKQPAMRKYKNA